MAKVEAALLNDSVAKILAYAAGEKPDGKKRNFIESIELQVRARQRASTPLSFPIQDGGVRSACQPS